MNNTKQSIRQKPLTAISSHFTRGINETKGIAVVIFIIKATHNAMIPNPYIMRYGLKNSFIAGASIPEPFFTVYLTHFSKPANRRFKSYGEKSKISHYVSPSLKCNSRTKYQFWKLLHSCAVAHTLIRDVCAYANSQRF